MFRSRLVKSLGVTAAGLTAAVGTVALAGPSSAIGIIAQPAPTPVAIDYRVYTTHTLGAWSAGAAYDSQGNLYVAEIWGGGLVKIDNAHHTLTTVVSPAGFGAAIGCNGSLSGPGMVAVDSSDRVYVSVPYCGKVERVNANGTMTTVAGGGASTAPSTAALDKKIDEADGIAVDASGALYVADSQAASVYRVQGGNLTTVAGTGTKGYDGDGIPATSAQLSAPFSLAVDGSGNLLVGDDGRIRRFSVGGTISTIAGTGVSGYSGDGGAATSAQVSDVLGIAVNQWGTIFFSDHTNERVRTIGTNGKISTYVGTGVAGDNGDGLKPYDTKVNWPHGVAVNPTNNFVSFVDASNSRVREVRPYTLFVPTSG